MRHDLPADPERWQKIETLLDAVLERPAGERGAFLDEACAGDAELRAQLEALLAADEAAGDFLITPAPEAVASLLAEAAADMDRVLGPYRLVREIGSGGMGVVYEAEDTRLRRRVAIKLLPPEYSRDPAAKERFLREARAASALDDPNICTVHDIGECDGQLYIVMACYEGETLKERLARGPLSVEEARQVAIQVARALLRAHEAGIVHRDIKPANVMLTRRGAVKVLDFGIAKIRGDATLTRTGSSPGTPAYMSPEQARGEPVDGRSDLWAVGVLLYEMLAGRRPFPGEDERAVAAMVQARDPKPLERLRPEVPPELARTVAKALAKAPNRRHQSAGELLGELERQPRRSRMPRFFRRAAILVGCLAVAVLLVFLLKGTFLRPPPTLRVAVLRPVMSSVGNNPDLAYVSSDVVEATMATLISIEGLQAIDPPEWKKEIGSEEAEKLRRAEANEVISPVIHCQGDECRVTLRRLQEPGDHLVGTVGPFEIQAGIESVQGLAEGIEVHMPQLYPDRRSESRASRVRSEDYSAYIQLQHRFDGGENLGAKALDQLEALLRTSPGLLGACQLAADVARSSGEIDRALGYTSQAEAMAPNDPRPLFCRFRAELAGRRLEAAQRTLKRLSTLIPGDARVPRAEADLLEARGELEKAYPLRVEVARRRPLWPQTVELATLEFRLGESDRARAHLEKFLYAQPANQHLRETLALFEASSGDLAYAASLYEELIRQQSTQRYFSNLGFIRYLMGDYAAAEKAYHQALILEPQGTFDRFSLAAVLEAEGKLSQARKLYSALAEEIAALPNLPETHVRMLHAQCLARLGRREEAALLAKEILKTPPEDFQVLHQAAQLYARLGERLTALYYAECAIKKDVRREWFTIPDFDPLKKDPEFQKLLSRAAPAGAGTARHGAPSEHARR